MYLCGIEAVLTELEKQGIANHGDHESLGSIDDLLDAVSKLVAV